MADVVRTHAARRPDEPALSFLCGGRAERLLTNAQLDRRARAVAAQLQEIGVGGQHVVLSYPPGLDFVIGFLGCLYAGCVAVPACPPNRRNLARFEHLVADASAGLVLSTTAAATQHQAMVAQVRSSRGHTASIAWLPTDDLPDALADRWEETAAGPDALAMLQYTSGSTNEPKGVLVSHTNLMHNTRAICEAFGVGERATSETGVFWLPTYHDMGLVGGVLVPLVAGAKSVLMAPSEFLQNPLSWLAAISTHRATISGGPNFAYDLCVRRITDEQRSTLDLSSWRLAFVGAEPIHPETLERFAAAFAPCGFRPSAFYPCFGMAEATLMLTGAVRGTGPMVRDFDEAAMLDGRAEPPERPTSRTRRLVSCGVAVGDLRIAITDVASLRPAEPGRIGEIWAAGASVAKGYWNQPEQSQQTFAAQRGDGREGDFLRTGDLGFVCEGELFVVGRLDDLLIVRGRNHHPQDLEATARACHLILEGGSGAAFGVAEGSEQRLILVHEAAQAAEADLSAALQACREAVLAEHGIALETIVLVRAGTVPKTSSGKVQRRACRAAFLADQLRIVARLQRDVLGVDRAAEGVTGTAPVLPSTIFAAVCQHALALGGASLSGVSPDTPLSALGLDSLQRVELAAKLEKTFSCRLPDIEFNPAQTLGEVASAVRTRLASNAGAAPAGGEVSATNCGVAHFPEVMELKRYERMLHAVAGENPYFRVDAGGDSACGLVNFGVYDYLAMARDPAVLEAAKAAIDRYGTSAGASRLVSGEKQVHGDLERALAAFLGTDAAIVFVSGHATNVTTIGHLLGPEDLVLYDALAHNSIMQGAQLSGATRRGFAHNDHVALDALLCEVRHRHRRVLIAVEGVYSMDGDSPDLPRFVEIKKKHKAMMLVDEAHSLGTMGRSGRGIGEHWGVARSDVDLWMGTLSKSLASCGGYIAGSAEMIQYLAYTAPGFVYSVGLAPSNAAAALAALTLLRAEPERVSRLGELAALFLTLAKARGLNTGSSAGTPVIPVIVGNSVKTLRLAGALRARGVNVQPILHPAVSEQAARLRFFITINHTEAQLRSAVDAVADELARL